MKAFGIDMIRRSFLVFGLLQSAPGCKNNSDALQVAGATVRIHANGSEIFMQDTIRVNDCIGVVTASDQFQFGDEIEILDGSFRKMETVSVRQEYQPLQLKCIAVTQGYFEVMLDNGERGFVRVDNPKLKFSTWEQHILREVFSVRFDVKSNPLKLRPDVSAPAALHMEANTFFPVQINGDWLQVKWGDESDAEHAWIKWNENGKLLIELFYFA